MSDLSTSGAPATRGEMGDQEATGLPPYSDYIRPYSDAVHDKIVAVERVERPSRPGRPANWGQWGEQMQADDNYVAAVSAASAGIEELMAREDRARSEYRERAKALLRREVPLPESVWGTFQAESWVKRAPARLKIKAKAGVAQSRGAQSLYERAHGQEIPSTQSPRHETEVDVDDAKRAAEGLQRSGLFDTTGLTVAAEREAIRGAAEALAGRLRAEGFSVEVQHSGSAAGPSSYLRVFDPRSETFFRYPVRISGHSKGVFNSQFVWNVGEQRHFDAVVRAARDMRESVTPEMLAERKRQAESMERYVIAKRLVSADKKIAKGKPLTKSEQEAVDARSRHQPSGPGNAPEVARTPLPEGATTVEVDGVERPALNSDGRPIHPTVDGVRNFWRWFGDSHVVDAEGRPLVVYHGTTFTNIEEFLPDGGNTEEGAKTLALYRKAKANNERFGYMNFRSGSFFSPKPEYAGNYTGEDRGVMYPAYIAASNPIYFDQRTSAVDGADPNKTPDALIMRDGGDINEIAVIDPTQIKSATGNVGTFDPANPDITMSRRRRVARRLGFDLEEAALEPCGARCAPEHDAEEAQVMQRASVAP